MMRLEIEQEGFLFRQESLGYSESALNHYRQALRHLSREEVEALFEAVEKKYDLRGRTMVEMLYGTGLRAIELCRLEVRDVDVNERLVFVRSGKGGKDRAVPMPEGCAYVCRAYLK